MREGWTQGSARTSPVMEYIHDATIIKRILSCRECLLSHRNHAEQAINKVSPIWPHQRQNKKNMYCNVGVGVLSFTKVEKPPGYVAPYGVAEEKMIRITARTFRDSMLEFRFFVVFMT